MLLGEYEHTIDDKNRLTLPAKFREELAAGVVVTRGMDGCLYAYPAGDWRERGLAWPGSIRFSARPEAPAALLLQRQRGGHGQAGQIHDPRQLLVQVSSAMSSSPVFPITSRSGIAKPWPEGTGRGGRGAEHVAERPQPCN